MGLRNQIRQIAGWSKDWLLDKREYYWIGILALMLWGIGKYLTFLNGGRPPVEDFDRMVVGIQPLFLFVVIMALNTVMAPHAATLLNRQEFLKAGTANRLVDVLASYWPSIIGVLLAWILK